jgi:hypothetical protein
MGWGIRTANLLSILGTLPWGAHRSNRIHVIKKLKWLLVNHFDNPCRALQRVLWGTVVQLSGMAAVALSNALTLVGPAAGHGLRALINSARC